MINVTSVFSQLNNPSSLGLFAIKDGVDATSRVGMAYYEGYKGKTKESIESGKHEARERFIDEFGASVAWLGGVPLFRAIYKKTVFKHQKLDPTIHLKKILSKGAQEFGTNDIDKFKNNLSEIAVKNKYKTAHIGMVLFSTVLPLFGIAYALPKFNKAVTSNILGEKKQRKALEQQHQDTVTLSKKADITFSAFNNKSAYKDQLKFKGLGSMILNTAEATQLTPTNSMIALDLGISGGRVVSYARKPQERYETALKEAGIIFFYFFATKLFKQGIEGIAGKNGLPINLDSKILEDKDLIKHILDSKEKGVNNKLIDNLPEFDQRIFNAKEFKKLNKDEQKKLIGELEETVIKFIDKNLAEGGYKDGKFSNYGLEAARKTGLIHVEQQDGKFVRNFNKYIETLDVANVFEDIKTYASKLGNKETLEQTKEFLKKTKNAKRAGAVINLLLCSISLGYILPKIQYIFREAMTGSNLFPAVKDELGAKKLSD